MLTKQSVGAESLTVRGQSDIQDIELALQSSTPNRKKRDNSSGLWSSYNPISMDDSSQKSINLFGMNISLPFYPNEEQNFK